jgi:ribose transport system permease protein
MLKRIISIPEAGIIVICTLLVLFFQGVNPVFLSPLNVAGILRATAYSGIVSIGLALCLISGTIDISVGATAGLASVVFSKLVVAGIPFVLSAMLTILIGFMAGSLNAFTIIRMKITPFIATISSMYMFRGLASFISGGFTIYPLPAEISAFGAAQPLGLSWPFLILIGLMILVTLILRYSVWGLCVRATGSDLEAARCTEVNTDLIQASVIALAGGFAALAGIMVTTILGGGQASTGTGWELIAIAGCAIGGVSLFGYQGSMFGLLIGLITLQVIQNGIVTIGVSPYLQMVTIGVILIVSITFEVKRRNYLNLERI